MFLCCWLFFAVGLLFISIMMVIKAIGLPYVYQRFIDVIGKWEYCCIWCRCHRCCCFEVIGLFARCKVGLRHPEQKWNVEDGVLYDVKLSKIAI